MSPKPKEVRAVIPPAAAERSTVKALAIFTASFALFWGSFAGILLFESWWAKIGCSLANGVFMGLFFIIGHDACHGSFAPQSWLNHVLGRLAFLPALYPFTSWEQGHNRNHHSWTNLRGLGRDRTWAPLTWEEYQRLSPLQRWLQRVYRHPLGVGFYCVTEFWWQQMMFPTPHELARMSAVRCALDRLSVVLHLGLQIYLAVAFRHSIGVAGSLLLGIGIPQIVWLWLMGFITYQQHTHPKVTWFDNEADWSFFAGAVQNTVHVVLPWPIGALLHNVMDHNAHHIDPRVPLYNLPAAQASVSEVFRGEVIESRITLREFWRIAAACQLYDYRDRRWLDFNGQPTTAG